MSLGAVLPISIRGSYDSDDLGRLDIFFRTLAAFSEPGTFSTFLIVTPPEQTNIVAQKCRRWPEFNIKVLSEENLVPELASYRHVRGWRKQQMVKLAAAREISEKFYITFDADVICLRHFGPKELIIDNKAILQYERRAQHPKWWKSSAKLLDTSPEVGDSKIGMTVTPAILSSELCLKLAEQLKPKGNGTWVDRLCKLHNPKSLSNWTIGRLLRSKWTEYSLYYLNAMKQNLLDQYHISAGSPSVPQLLLVHESHPFETWDTATSFSADNPGIFCVVGSKSGIEPRVVWERIKPFIPASEEPSTLTMESSQHA